MLDGVPVPELVGKRKLRSFIAKVEALHDFWSMIFLLFLGWFLASKNEFCVGEKLGDCHGITGFFVH